MRDEVNKYIYDINNSIDSINSYLGDRRNFNDYLNDKMMRRDVERELEIIGEAMNHLNKLEPNIKISNKQKIISMRNRVIHGYDKIDNEIIWGTIIRHLPILKKDVINLLNKEH